MQTFICPECGKESTYDPWHTSARCPACGYVPPKKMETGYHMTPESRQRIARLKSLRAWLTVLLIAIIPSLIVIGVFGILPRLELEARGAAYALVGIIGGVIGLLFLPTIVALLIVERLIARQLIKSWQRLADRAGLTFNPKGGRGRLPLGSVSGTYKGRRVEVFAQAERRKLRTCATITLVRPVEADIKLLLSGNTATQDQPPSRETPLEQVVTVEGASEGFADEVLADPSLKGHLLHIRRGSIIWLRGDRITLQQHAAYGIERDMAYIVTVLEALSVLAGAVEAGSHRQLK
jgi:hypothetical protein